MTRYGVPGPQSQGWVRNHTRNKCSNGDGSPSGSTLQLRNNERDGVSNHQRFDCLLNHLFNHRSKKTSKLRVTGLCEGNPPVLGGPVDSAHKRAGNGKCNHLMTSSWEMFLHFRVASDCSTVIEYLHEHYELICRYPVKHFEKSGPMKAHRIFVAYIISDTCF